MGRATRSTKSILITGVITITVFAAGALGINYQAQQNSNQSKTTSTPVKVKKTTQISYKGEEGKTALELLKTHSKVQTKSSSFGEFVVSINGNDGDGKMYWTFYVNDKESEVGAGTYISKSSDIIKWKLQ